MAMLFEVGLGFVGVVIAWAAGIDMASQLTTSQEAILRGTVASLPMVLMLIACYKSTWQPIVRLRREVEKVVAELFAGCGWLEFALVSVAAGIGEEILFRGALQPFVIGWTVPWIGIVVVALLFGLAHALTQTYFILATLIGLYFGWLAFAYDDLIAPIVAHAVYDCFAMMFIQRQTGKTGNLPPAT